MIVYVQPGPLPMGETVLRQTLNMLREYYGDFSVRVDEGDDSPATGTARRWASEHSFPLQHHGIPAAIIVPGDPHEHTARRISRSPTPATPPRSCFPWPLTTSTGWRAAAPGSRSCSASPACSHHAPL